MKNKRVKLKLKVSGSVKKVLKSNKLSLTNKKSNRKGRRKYQVYSYEKKKTVCTQKIKKRNKKGHAKIEIISTNQKLFNPAPS